jgi:hypothetical protein
MLFHFRLFAIIIIFLNSKLFHLKFFRLCEVIVSYFWLVKIISPYVIIGYFMLYYHRLFMTILLVVIVGYYICGYWFGDNCWIF